MIALYYASRMAAFGSREFIHEQQRGRLVIAASAVRRVRDILKRSIDAYINWICTLWPYAARHERLLHHFIVGFAL